MFVFMMVLTSIDPITSLHVGAYIDRVPSFYYNKTELTSPASVFSFINGGIFCEQKRLTSLKP